MNQVRLGIIGCGYWGPNLIRNFIELKESEVVVVADLDPSRLDTIRTRYHDTITTTDYHDLFTMNLDAVVIATPPSTHYLIARECLEQGLHTLIEKPMTLDSRHAEILIELAANRNLVLMVGHTFEFNPAVQAVKEIIDSGVLGKIYYVDTVRVNLGLFQNHLNVIWDLAPHDISILRYLLGTEPTQVSACGSAFILPNIHDLAYISLQFPDNVMAHIHVSWLDPNKVRQITIVGSKKMLVYDDVAPLEKIRIYDKSVTRLPYTNTFGDFELSYRYGDISIPHINFTEPLRIECQHFVVSIINGTPPKSDGHAGLQVVKVLELAERSLHSGYSQTAEQEKTNGYIPVRNK
ncbi:MAG: Gfo/Idh/MocA family oxidoreductase [Actinomycetia bacterium]|nr:Gfo/Idh/MocA family oxidoreductase [Actinomycetes bacterium]